MNRDIYRLVPDEDRKTWIAAAEIVRGRRKRSSRRRLAALAVGLAAAGAGISRAGLAPPAAGALPIPSSGARPFVFAGAVSGGQPVTTGNAMNIETASRALGLNWASFNIGSGATVRFTQPDAASRVLNRIWSNDPSQIMGRLSANGQVYLINQNGILFGNGAQVNVGGLVASALNLSDSMTSRLLNTGLPATRNDTLEFAWDGSAAGFQNGFVTVEAGAAIRTPTGGRVVLIAPKTVENLGLIEGGAGAEAILAAGGKVILTAPDDPSLRGLLVETRSFVGTDALGNSVSLDGSVTNKGDGAASGENGRIRVGTGGTVSLAALAVNQKGFINATQAVNLNGTTMLVSGTTETNRLTINQRGDKAEIDWVGGFDVGVGKTVEFAQSSTGAVAYNYVNDADRTAADGSILDLAGRSQIDGTLKARGQLVLINEKGIDFGAKAKVSAANFVASALGINPDMVASGLLLQDGVSARSFYLNKTPIADPPVADPQVVAPAVAETPTPRVAVLNAFRLATVNVAAGATIDSARNGYVILAGAKVTQAGTVTTPSGQTLLAGGADLYLKPAYGAALRGFSPEVNPLYVLAADSIGTWIPISRGADANAVTNNGTITAALGNITLVGHEITQGGKLSTTTSTTANGSIRLLARDQVAISGAGEPAALRSQRNLDAKGIAPFVGDESYNINDKANQPEFTSGRVGGTLTLAAGSTTQVALDGRDGKTLTADQTFVSSSIEAVGKQIVLAGTSGAAAGAVVEAKGGRLQFRASDAFDLNSAFASDPLSTSQTSAPPAGVGIFVGTGVRLDAAGALAQKSVAELFTEVELRGDEFAQNPVQRSGKLRGAKAWVDIRDPVSIADLSGWTGKVGQTIAEKAATAGTISLRSAGSIVVKQGADLDVSGGRVNYAGAEVKESRAVMPGGQSYRLNDAPVSATYATLATVTRPEVAYSEGKSAGTVELVGHSLAVDGRLEANTTVGTRQRAVANPAGNRYAIPLGGQLIVKDSGQHFTVANSDAAANPDVATDAAKDAAWSQAQISFVKGAATAASSLAAGDAAGPRLELSQSLVAAGFSRFDITSDGRIDVLADVTMNLAPGGSFLATGRQVHVAGDIAAPAGTIGMTTRDMSKLLGDFPRPTDARYSTLVLAGSASLSTSGHWVNDYLDGKAANSATAINGGAITLTSAYDLDLRPGSRVDVSGGGRLKSDGKLEAGNAGSITLSTGGVKGGGFNFTEDADRRDAGLFLGATLAGYALGTGGSLAVNTSAIRFGTPFATDSRTWSRATRLASGQVGAAFDGAFVNQGGFFSFSFVGRDGVMVGDNVRIAPTPVNWSLAKFADYRDRTTGSALADFAQPETLHSDRRAAPTSIALATRSLGYGDLLVGDGAYVGASPQGSISLESQAQLTVLGTLEAPAGRITLSRPANLSEKPYSNDFLTFTPAKAAESIYLGPDSRLLAGGTTVLTAATRMALDAGVSADLLRSLQRYRGSVLDGGTVSINAGMGYLATRAGRMITGPDGKVTQVGGWIDVSGATDRLNAAADLGVGVGYPLQTLGSAGGTVSLAAREGMFLDGSYKAAGGARALGGTFSLRFADAELKSDPWELSTLAANAAENVATRTVAAAEKKAAYETETDAALKALRLIEYNAATAEVAVAVAERDTLLGPTRPRTLSLYQSAGSRTNLWPSAVDSADYLSGSATLDPAQFSGLMALDVTPLKTAGFGSWYLASQDAMRFTGAITATVNNQLRLDAASFSATTDASRLSLTAAAAQIGNFAAGAAAAAAGAGTAQATITARDIGLVGTFDWSGFASSRFVSKGELHFDSTDNAVANRPGGRLYNGQMSASGALELSAARLSPATYSDFRVVDPGGSITITRPAGAGADAAISPAGRIEFAAASIDHRGTVTAPLGEIVFSSPGGSVTLGSGSVTSVATDRDLLLGHTIESGTKWKYEATRWGTGALGITKIAATTYDIAAAPAKSIRIDAAQSTVVGDKIVSGKLVPGARLDLSGGGEAFAWEFSAGPGGKNDVLQGATTSFAILPGTGGIAGWNGFSATDSQLQKFYNATAIGSSGYSQVPALKPGDRISLASGAAGVVGSYVLLPARYAMLPGAMLVTVKTDAPFSGAKPQTDGSWLVSGTRLAVNADGSTTAYSQRPLTLELASSAVTARRAKYLTTTASEYFFDSPGANLPGDAGRLTAIGRTSLAFDPAIIATRRTEIAAADGRVRAGRGLEIDLAAPWLLIADGANAPAMPIAGAATAPQAPIAGSAAPEPTWSVLDQGKLNALGASSLLLGGVRSIDGMTTLIDTIAEKVDVRNSGVANARDALTGAELLLTARDQLTVSAGSRIEATGNADARAIVLRRLNGDGTVGPGDGAFLRAAGGSQATVTRDGSIDRTLEADLVLAATARVAGRSLVFDATRSDTLSGTVALGTLQGDGNARTGGYLTIGAGRINVVGDGTTPADGLTLKNADLSRFATADQLRLNSYTTLDLYGNAALGTGELQELVIAAGGIAGHGNASQVASISAKSLLLENPNPDATRFVAGATLGSGALKLSADDLRIGSNATATMRTAETNGFAIRGFADNPARGPASPTAAVSLTATGDLRFEGRGVTAIDNLGGDGSAPTLAIGAARVVTAAAADHLLATAGKTRIASNDGSTGGNPGLGGALEMRAKAIDIAGRIETPSGRLVLAATGNDATDNVTVKDKAAIAADGVRVAFADTAAYAPAGQIVLRSAKGNVELQNGAVVSVSAAAEGGDAGALRLEALEGSVTAAAGSLQAIAGPADTGARQGELTVDAKAVDLDAMAAAVRQTAASGTVTHFTGAWDVRRRVGDLTLSKEVKAGTVKLAADVGNIDIQASGSIDASGSKGGNIQLYANRGRVTGGDAATGGRIDLRAGSALRANATELATGGQGTAGRGGSVTVGVSATSTVDEAGTAIDFAAASSSQTAALIDVSTAAGSAAAPGRVLFRVPRQDTEQALKTLGGAAINTTSSVLTVLAGAGTAAAYTVAPVPAMNSYQPGMVAVFSAPATSTGALTLNVNAKGAKALVQPDGTAFSASARITAGQVVTAVYDGTRFVVSSTGLADTGTSGSAYKVAFASKPAALATGLLVSFRARNANPAGAVSLAVNGDAKLTASLVDQNGAALAANAIAANQLVTAVYDGTRFRLINDTSLVATPSITGSNLAGSLALNGTIVGPGSSSLEAVRTISKSYDLEVNTDRQRAYMAQTKTAATLFGGTPAGMAFRPGLQIASARDITVANDWDLSAARFNGQPGFLTLRAAGNLNINGTLSDGFLANGSNTAFSRDAKLAGSGQSWSYRLVAGADTAAASPLATESGAVAGNITLATNKLVRTGTGDIDLAARRDIKLFDRAAIFTAGTAATVHPTGFAPITSGTAQNSIYSAFPSGGGDLSLTAGERLVMVNTGASRADETPPVQRTINQWLFRNGNGNRDLQWWPRIASFQQGVAAFGGGDISLLAGTDVKDFTAFIPTNGRVPTIDAQRQPDLAVVQGGGDLNVRAAGTVDGGMFYAETGRLRIEAAALASDVGIALGNASARVIAAGDAALGSVFNPMWASSRFVVNSGQNTVSISDSNYTSAARFGTYSPTTAFDLVSVTGNVALNPGDNFFLGNDPETLRLVPPRFKVAALNGDLAGTVAQAPGENSQLELLAAGSLTLGTAAVRQLDVPATVLPSVRNPLPGANFKLLSLMTEGTVLQQHSATGWHAGDHEPSRLIALAGSISGQAGESNFASFNEAVRIEAGASITDLSVVAQHASSNDVSIVKAGAGVAYSVNGGLFPSLGIAVGGPGRLEVTAGLGIDLGDSRGIVTRGNLDNPNLPETGAGIFALAGAAPDYAAFRSYLKVGADVGETSLRDRFYTLLRDYGRQAGTGGGAASYEKGREAIRALFPQLGIKGGDINLFASQIKTEQGGGIDLLTPGGSIVVGVADPSIKKKSSVQGLFTLRDGDIRAFAKNNFLVNQSRVFTLDGGSILVWADRGSIDAGSGAKTVSATPPPALVIRNGQMVLDTSNSVSGSGIGVLASRDDTPASDMDLFAPQGAIDAGDAGLRSTGNITLGARTILNATNIQAAGTVTGAPAPVAAPAPAPAPAPAKSDQGEAQAATAALGNRESRQGILTVEVLGGVDDGGGVPGKKKEEQDE